MVYCTHNIHVFDIFEICKQRKKLYLYNNHTKRKYRNDNVKYILQVVYKQKIIFLSHQIAELQCVENSQKNDRPTDRQTDSKISQMYDDPRSRQSDYQLTSSSNLMKKR